VSTSHFRSPELLKLASGQSCTIKLPGCVGGPCVACHSNQAKHGKGRSVKAHDCFIAFGCDHCHREIDQGKTLSREQKFDAWERAHIATMLIIFPLILTTQVQHRPRTVERHGSALSSSKCLPRRA
jgi:hypothetical protein